MRVAEAHLQDAALHFGLVTDTHQLLLDLVAFGYAYDHVMDQRTVQAVHRTVAGLIGRTGDVHLISLDGDGNIRVHLLAQRPERSFHAYHVVGTNRDGHPGGQVYR